MEVFWSQWYALWQLHIAYGAVLIMILICLSTVVHRAEALWYVKYFIYKNTNDLSWLNRKQKLCFLHWFVIKEEFYNSDTSALPFLICTILELIFLVPKSYSFAFFILQIFLNFLFLLLLAFLSNNPNVYFKNFSHFTIIRYKFKRTVTFYFETKTKQLAYFFGFCNILAHHQKILFKLIRNYPKNN